MDIFLTSSPCIERAGDLNPANGLIEELKRTVKKAARGIFISSAPADSEFTEYCAFTLKDAFLRAGLSFFSYETLDNRNADKASTMISNADFIILSGGHVPTQNAFFERISLRYLLSGFCGVVLGISAGSMNSADVVYAVPELEGESADPDYQRYLIGLDLTKNMIIPHYQENEFQILDGKRLYEDIVYPDSVGKKFYVFPDGTYLYSCNGRESIRGEAYKIENGEKKKICSDGEEICL